MSPVKGRVLNNIVYQCDNRFMWILKHCLAEKVQSLGKDWHRACLRCTKCKKTLSSGGHAEVLLINC